MKTSRLFLSLSIILLSLMSFLNYVQAQVDHFVNIGFNNTSLSYGTVIKVPILMTGSQIGAFRHIIKYDRDVLTYSSISIPVSSPLAGR